MDIRVAHLADIQINCNDKNAHRVSEYRQVLNDTANSIINHKVDFVVLAGDIFERYDTTEIERALYTTFIHKLLRGLPKAKILCIDGNHDVRKRNMQFFDGNNQSVKVNILADLHQAINNDRYIYSTNAQFYSVPYAEDNTKLVFALWSELGKYDSMYGNHSPYANYTVDQIDTLLKSATVVDVYHGTLPGAKDLGQDKGYELTADDVVLPGHMAMLGHIHKYQCLQGKYVYASSLVQRSMNEGDLYDSNGWVYENTLEHGYVLWNIDTKTLSNTTFEFKRMHQPVKMVSILLNDKITVDYITQILAKYRGSSVTLQIILEHSKIDPELLAFIYNYVPTLGYVKIKDVRLAKQAKLDTMAKVAANRLELTYEAFEDISKSLLEPVLNATYADANFRKQVLAKTLELLKQECGYHLHPETINQIRLISCDIANFKTIDSMHIDFPEHGLLALRGQNKHGKTTCLEAICFCLTLQHNETFKRNAKKQQLIRLFNDKRPDVDSVKVETKLSINGIVYEVCVTLFKHMQADYDVKHWKQFVNKIDQVVEVYCEGELRYSGDMAANWLQQNFGTYYEFAILHSINQATLDSIKYMDANELVNFMLQRLGYSVLSKLRQYYQGCKQAEQDKHPMTTQATVVELEQSKLQYQELLKNLDKQLQEQTSELLDLSNNIALISENINNLYADLISLPAKQIEQAQSILQGHEFDTQESLANDYAIVKAEYDKLSSEQDNANGLCESYRTNVAELKQKQADLQIEYAKTENELYASIRVKRQDALTAIHDKQNKLNAYKQELNDLFSKCLAARTSELQSKLDSISKEWEGKLVLANQINNEIHELQAKASSIANITLPSLQSKLSNLETDLGKCTMTLSTMHKNQCPTCNQVWHSSSIKDAMLANDTEIAKLQSDIEDTKAAIKEAEDMLKQSQTELTNKELSDDRKSLLARIDELVSLRDAISKDLSVNVDAYELANKYSQAEFNAILTNLHSEFGEAYALTNIANIANIARAFAEWNKVMQNSQVNLDSIYDSSNATLERLVKEARPDLASDIATINDAVINAELALQKAYEDSSILRNKVVNAWQIMQTGQALLSAKQLLLSLETSITKNADTNAKIAERKQELETLRAKHAQVNGLQLGLVAKVTEANNAIKAIEVSIEQRIAYDISQAGLKMYKRLIETDLPGYLYDHACTIVNEYIASQDLNTDLCPRLDKDNYGTLVLVDRMANGAEVTRPISEASGMEITISALLVCLAMHHAGLSTDFPTVLMDELSGKLSTGTADDPVDYLALFTKILKKASAKCQLLLIDHRLDDNAFDGIIKIVKDPRTNLSSNI